MRQGADKRPAEGEAMGRAERVRSGGCPMPTEENKDNVRRILEEVVNQGELGVADKLLASDYVYRSPGSPEVRGPEGYKQLITTFRRAFPDLHVTLDDMIAEGDKVVTGFTWRGTHRGEFMGLAPTGKRVTVA